MMDLIWISIGFLFHSSELLGEKTGMNRLTSFFPLHVLLFVVPDATHSSKAVFG